MHKPFTVQHFQEFARTLTLDNENQWEPEPFQLEFVADLFAGYRECWLICPEAQGKTTLLAGIAVYTLEFKPDAVIPIAASTREQILILHEQAEGFIKRSGLTDKFKCLWGSREIRRKDKSETGKIKVYASDDGTADGILFTLAITDELHRHKNLRLYRTWLGKTKKRGGQVLAISTAGEIGSEFEDVRLAHREKATKRTVDGSHIRAEAEGMVLHDWSVPPDDDVTDMNVVKAANPLSTVTLDVLEEGFNSPTMSLPHWRRFTCNQAARREGEGINPSEWDVLASPNLEFTGSWCVGGVDFGWKRDTTALVIVGWESTERRVVLATRVYPAPVEQKLVVKGLAELQKQFNPVTWAFDPNAEGNQMVELLEAGEHPHQEGVEFSFHKHDQGKPMAEAAAYLAEAVHSGWLVHDGDPVLREHVLNSLAVETKYGDFRYERPKHATGEQRAKYPIDAMSALLMAHKVAVDENNEPAPVAPMFAVVGH
jgi:phage terminase large subunit-like protein